ncbi:MAG: hypothetical protein AMXMBFR84_43600 [Candidatus Hydrogenedentota bacterium]
MRSETKIGRGLPGWIWKAGLSISIGLAAGCGSGTEETTAPVSNPSEPGPAIESPVPADAPPETESPVTDANLTQEERDSAFQDRLDTLRNEMDAAVDELLQQADSNRDEARAAWEAWLKESDEKLAELSREASKVSEDGRIRWEAFRQEIESKQQPIQDAVTQWREAADAAGAEILEGLKRAASEMNTALEKAAETYKRETGIEPVSAEGSGSEPPEAIEPPQE